MSEDCMQNTSLKIEIDTTSLDTALEKVRQLKAELRQLGLPYVTGNSLGIAGDYSMPFQCVIRDGFTDPPRRVFYCPE